MQKTVILSQINRTNFALFLTLEGMNLDHDFVQVWKFSEYQKKKANGTLFFPNLG